MMASTSQTNQQLAFARAQQEAAVNAGTTVAQYAHWQAGVLQLDLALQSYAGELLQLAQLKVQVRPGAGMFSRLAEDFIAANKASAELDQWVRLERDSESWLGIHQLWCQNPLQLISNLKLSSVRGETTLTAQPSEGGMIKVVEVAQPKMPPFSATVFQEAVRSATDLIRRQREHSAEY